MLDKTIHTQFKILNHTEMIFSSLVLQSDLFFSLSIAENKQMFVATKPNSFLVLCILMTQFGI
jgi:hypothetical protein